MRTPAQTLKIPLDALRNLRLVAALTGERQHEVLTRLLLAEVATIKAEGNGLNRRMEG